MNESTIKIAIPQLLPGIMEKDDRCLERLENALQGQRGIHRAHLERENSPVQLCLHYDASRLSSKDIQNLAKRAGSEIARRYHHRKVNLEGLDCSDCVLVVEHSLSRLEGVLHAKVNYATQTLQLEYDSRVVSLLDIEKRLHQLGYRVVIGGMRGWLSAHRELLFSLLSGWFLVLGWVGEQFVHLPYLAGLIFYSIAYLLGGYDIVRSGLRSLKKHHFDTDVLMLLAAVGAVILGEFAEGALLLFLFSLGRALEEHFLRQARRAIQALADLTPRTALVKRNGIEIDVPVDDIGIGETVIVKPGVRIAVDGVIVRGTSTVNQAPVTGEAIPVEKTVGSPVFAGTINGEGLLEVRTTRLAKDSTLARVIRLVEHAQGQKTPTLQWTERVMRVFVPVVLVGVLTLIVVPPILGVPFRESFLKAMALLVAASPCALALGTPAAILSGIARAARQGVLVKGGVHLENLGNLKVIAFDKTGTITQGMPEVTDIIIPTTGALLFQKNITEFHPGLSKDSLQAKIIGLAAAVEIRSAHPLAQALVKAASELGVDIPEVEQAKDLTGWGAEAVLSGHRIYVGSLKKLERQSDQRLSTDQTFREHVAELEAQGKTVVVVVEDGDILGGVAIADRLRPGVKDCIQTLKNIGMVRTVLLTGDHRKAAEVVALQAGLDEYYADLLPQEKLELIQGLIERYEWVGMVGDGVNDAPALARATVGIALGGATTDVALETADVVLMGEDLAKLPFIIGLGRATRRIIMQNLILSLLVMVGLVVFSLTTFANIGIAIFLHEGSTLLVVLNALRLLGYRIGNMVSFHNYVQS